MSSGCAQLKTNSYVQSQGWFKCFWNGKTRSITLEKIVCVKFHVQWHQMEWNMGENNGMVKNHMRHGYVVSVSLNTRYNMPRLILAYQIIALSCLRLAALGWIVVKSRTTRKRQSGSTSRLLNCCTNTELALEKLLAGMVYGRFERLPTIASQRWQIRCR